MNLLQHISDDVRNIYFDNSDHNALDSENI